MAATRSGPLTAQVLVQAPLRGCAVGAVAPATRARADQSAPVRVVHEHGIRGRDELVERGGEPGGVLEMGKVRSRRETHEATSRNRLVRGDAMGDGDRMV